VAPGRLVETRSLHDGQRSTRWSQGIPVPTYCMVIGLAEFQVTHMGASDGVPISAWVFPEDAPLAARKLERSALVLERFSDLVAPFPFEKLAHVQSSTAWGATEYASAVFYAEKQFQGESASDGIVAPPTGTTCGSPRASPPTSTGCSWRASGGRMPSASTWRARPRP
jgi:hypothetical protein